MNKLKKLIITLFLLVGLSSPLYAATELQGTNPNTNALEKVTVRDGRLDVASSSDPRAYFNSRDKGQTFSLIWNNINSTSGGNVVYWKNTDLTKDLVISSVGLNSDIGVLYELNFVSGTAVGTSATPTNLNKDSNNDASAVALNTTAITGLTTISEIDHAFVTAGGHQELRLGDRVRLGQNDAVAVRIEVSFGTIGAPIHSAGVIFGFYE